MESDCEPLAATSALNSADPAAAAASAAAPADAAAVAIGVAAAAAVDDRAHSSEVTQSLGGAAGTTAKSKVDILLKPAGDAPILKQKNWKVERSQRLSFVVDFTSKYLKLSPDESLFFYVSQCFAPAPDAELGPLYDCFGSDGKLVLHYCKTQAWG